MSFVDFNDAYNGGSTEVAPKGMVGFCMRRGLSKTEASAHRLLLVVGVVFFLASIFIFVGFSDRTPGKSTVKSPPIPQENL